MNIGGIQSNYGFTSPKFGSANASEFSGPESGDSFEGSQATRRSASSNFIMTGMTALLGLGAAFLLKRVPIIGKLIQGAAGLLSKIPGLGFLSKIFGAAEKVAEGAAAVV